LQRAANKAIWICAAEDEQHVFGGKQTLNADKSLRRGKIETVNKREVDDCRQRDMSRKKTH
jgi:hypothetical protein